MIMKKIFWCRYSKYLVFVRIHALCFFSLTERRRDASSWQRNVVYPLCFLVLLLLTVSVNFGVWVLVYYLVFV